MTDIRIGHGYDLHRFIIGKKLMLGGVEIEHSHGLAAHSDGDAVIHALADAILGAVALPDIGQCFPDTDEQTQNIDSAEILKHAMKLIKQKGYGIGNADITIITQQPKIAPHAEAMQTKLAELMHTTVDRINIKATTEEGLGATGTGEALAVHAVVLLRPASA